MCQGQGDRQGARPRADGAAVRRSLPLPHAGAPSVAHKLALSLLRRLLRSEDERGHKHIANLVAEHETPQTMFAVLEYCGGGSLQRLLQQQQARGPLGMCGMDAPRVADLAKQLASALKYLHSCGVAHRDIKPGNILFDAEGALKLCDFGFATRCHDHELKQQCGTPSFFAPELTMAHEGYLGRPVDMWALGCVLFEMLHGLPAFSGGSVEQLFTRIRAANHVPFAPDLPGEARSIISALLTRDPMERLTAAALLDEPWIRSAPQTRSAPPLLLRFGPSGLVAD